MKMQRSFRPALILLLCVLYAATSASGQIRQLRIGVDGLTCSQCTRSVEMSLRRLPFVADVRMDLDSTRGTVTLIEGEPLAPDAVARAVSDAGFSLRYLHIILERPGVQARTDSCMPLSGVGFVPSAPWPADTSGSWTFIVPVASLQSKKARASTVAGCMPKSYRVMVRSGSQQ